MPIVRLCLLILSLTLLSTAAYAGEDADEYYRHRDSYINDLKDHIACLKKTNNWNGWEVCHAQNERRQKERRLEELKKEQMELEKELNRK